MINMSIDERKPILEKIKSTKQPFESMVDVDICDPAPGPRRPRGEQQFPSGRTGNLVEGRKY